MGEFVHASPGDSGVILRPDAGGLKPASRMAHDAFARVRAVLGTYPPRWHIRICAVLLLAFVFGLLAIPQDVRGRTWMLLVQLTTVCAIFAGILSEHAKEQLLDARAALTPAYRVPHLVVWLVALLAAVVLMPATMAPMLASVVKGSGVYLIRLSPAGVAAFVSLWAVTIAWCGYFTSVWTLVPLAGLVSLFTSAAVRAQTLDVLSGNAPGTTAGVLAFSLAAVAVLAWRLMTATEESPDWRRVTTNWGLRVGMTGDAALRETDTTPGDRNAGPIATAAALFEPLLRRTGRDLHREPPGALFGAHFWWRVRHYRLVSTAAWRPVALGVLIVAVLAILAGVVSLNDHRPADAFRTALLLISFAVTVLPGIVVGFLWPRRWLTIGYEAVLPSTRRRFILEAGAAMLIDQIVLWLSCQLAALLFQTIAMLLLQDAQTQITPLDYGRFILVIGGMALPQLLIFGVVTAAMRLRSALFSFLIIFPLAFLPAVPIVIARWLSDGYGEQFQIVAAFVTTLSLGLLSIGFSWWVWRDAEFE